MLSGVKTNFYLIGLDPRASRADCESSKGRETETILDWALKAGMTFKIPYNTNRISW
ncbi:hypothetical protein DPMN_102112 [Dreissena polymorpha]|uniref:Uncharacterized protein n=1 Tax=Dreissena polymorpha TaxID=45954 RepID=A0A9D4LL09_DREPO|nr:hypothetical protein DPMN_102112 [Dreissena polymorpha]